MNATLPASECLSMEDGYEVGLGNEGLALIPQAIPPYSRSGKIMGTTREIGQMWGIGRDASGRGV